MVQIKLDEQQHVVYNHTVSEMVAEFNQSDPLQAEMLKNLLKNLLIRSNRLFRSQNTIGEIDDANIDFARKFSELVEKNFINTKQVDAYAENDGACASFANQKTSKIWYRVAIANN